MVNFPRYAVYDVPRAYTVDEVPNSAASIRSDVSCDETRKYLLVDGGPVFLLNFFVVTELVKGEESGTVSASSVRCVGLL